jgi:hypothetical protein
MDKLLREEEELTFQPLINDNMGVPASMQILHPEMAGVEMKMRQKRHTDHLEAERNKHQVRIKMGTSQALSLQRCVSFSFVLASLSTCLTKPYDGSCPPSLSQMLCSAQSWRWFALGCVRHTGGPRSEGRLSCKNCCALEVASFH